MYECVYVWVCVCMSVYVWVHVCIHVVRLCDRVIMCKSVLMCVWVCVYMNECVCLIMWTTCEVAAQLGV